MQRETGTMFLPTRRRFTAAALRRGCAPPWRRWRRDAVARAERTADGRVHLVVLRPARGGVTLTCTGVGAAQGEILAPLAARMRHALASRDGAGLGGTSSFEDAVAALLRDAPAPPGARPALVRLGRRCPAAPALRTMPDPDAVLAHGRRTLARALGSTELAARLQALARAFAAIAPVSPSRS